MPENPVEKRISQNGFTLIELLVAAALGMVVLIAAALLMGRGLAVWQRTEGNLQQLFLVEKGLDMLGRELRNGVALADLPFEGSSDSLFFATADTDVRMSQIRYALQPQLSGDMALMRESQPFPPGDTQPIIRKAVIPGVKTFSIRYATMKESDSGQKVLGWTDAWPANVSSGVPKLMELCLETVDSRGFPHAAVREYRVPQGSFGVAVEKK